MFSSLRQGWSVCATLSIQTEPKKIEGRLARISSIALCICLRTSSPIVLTTEGSSAASGAYSFPTLIGARNCTCHLDGRGTGQNGNVYIGKQAQPETPAHPPRLLF